MEIQRDPPDAALKIINDTLKSVDKECAKVKCVLLSLRSVVKTQDGFVPNRDFGCVEKLCRKTREQFAEYTRLFTEYLNRVRESQEWAPELFDSMTRASLQPKAKRVCNFFRRGKCKFGEECKFSHETGRSRSQVRSETSFVTKTSRGASARTH